VRRSTLDFCLGGLRSKQRERVSPAGLRILASDLGVRVLATRDATTELHGRDSSAPARSEVYLPIRERARERERPGYEPLEIEGTARSVPAHSAPKLTGLYHTYTACQLVNSRPSPEPAPARPEMYYEIYTCRFWRGQPHGGVRPFHQKSTCLTQLTLGRYVVQSRPN